MKQLMKYNRILLGLAAILTCQLVHAQIDTLKVHIQKINMLYDSARGLAFDAQYSYDSDTIYSNYQRLETEGTIMLDGPGRFYVKQGKTESMQNDSIAVDMLVPEKIMMISKARNAKGKDYLPFRQRLDTMVKNNFFGYTPSILKTDSVNTINLVSSDTLAIYKSINIKYNPRTYAIQKISVTINYFANEDYVGLTPLPLKKAIRQFTMNVFFLRYRVANMTEDFFNPKRYYWQDPTGKALAAGKYEGFEVYSDLPVTK
jgi:hypothetical protein